MDLLSHRALIVSLFRLTRRSSLDQDEEGPCAYAHTTGLQRILLVTLWAI